MPRSDGASPRGARTAGFTFLELVLVLAVLGVLFAISVPSLTGMVPRYRMRSAARGLGTTLEQVRLNALSRGLWMGVRYAVTAGAGDRSEASYYQIIAPPPEDYPDQPIADRQLLDKQEIPLPVRIARVILSGNQAVDRGAVSILFSPMGNAGSHIVVLEDAEGRIFSLKMNSITGTIELFEGTEASFQHYVE